MEKVTKSILCLLCIIIIASCQKIAIEDIAEEVGNKNGKSTVTFKISKIEQIPFSTSENTSRTTDITQLCSHIYFAVYKTDGERLIYDSQNSSDKDFGEFSVKLDNGSYRIVILAYNSKDNPTATNPEKITFGNNGKMTDTFLWSDEISVVNNLEKEINMHRAVAMFRLITTDKIPENIAKIKFHYTGGSSTINAITGTGNANSKQDETFTISETGKTGTFDVYTFPKDDENLLKIEITALDANNNTVLSRTFEDVPISRNKITQYKGEFFTGENTESTTLSFKLTTNDEWTVIDKTY